MTSRRVITWRRASRSTLAPTRRARQFCVRTTRLDALARSGRRATRYRRVKGASRGDAGACHSTRGADDADERRVDLVASRVSRDESRAIVTLHRMSSRDGGGETETRAPRRRFARGLRDTRNSSFAAFSWNLAPRSRFLAQTWYRLARISIEHRSSRATPACTPRVTPRARHVSSDLGDVSRRRASATRDSARERHDRRREDTRRARGARVTRVIRVFHHSCTDSTRSFSHFSRKL